MAKKKGKLLYTILEILILMIVFQLLREMLFRLIKPIFPDTFFISKMINMVIMFGLSIVILAYVKIIKQDLSIFPKFTKKYVVFTIITLLLYITTPSNYTEGFTAIMCLIYGSIVTPIYEELLFRGYIWNRMKTVLSKEKYVYLCNVLFFAIWHIGYMGSNIITGNWYAVMGKIMAGIIYGLILGFVRIKSKNCYATILLHGVLNLFMI